ncbi:MAG: substrate-binding domain-containing protein [Acidimicrobiales bacterium]
MTETQLTSKTRRQRRGAPGAALLAVALAAAACSGGGGNADGPGDCAAVYTSVSSEKIRLMTDLATEFNDSDAELADGTCIYVEVQSKASGLGAQLLVEGWDELADGPRPVIWSPASSAWGSVVNQLRDDAGAAPVVGDGTPFMVTPLVIAMPEPMATARLARRTHRLVRHPRPGDR